MSLYDIVRKQYGSKRVTHFAIFHSNLHNYKIYVNSELNTRMSIDIRLITK